MLALWVLGPQLELVLGRARFLALYLLSRARPARRWSTGLAAEGQPTLGASGAIFGLFGALLIVATRSAATCAACWSGSA